MTLTQYLQSQGLKQTVIDDLLPYIAPHGESGFFWDAARIMAPCEFYHLERVNGFLLVGSCPDGSCVAINTASENGAVFYIALEYLSANYPVEEMVIQVAESPSDWISKVCEDDFPYDYCEASSR
jgi:hypothetical protein